MSDPQEQLIHTNASGRGAVLDLSLVHDLPLKISVEVGRLRLSVGDFLRLSVGSVLEVKKPAGEPFEISINGRIVARGEVVMVEQTYGVRIVEVLKTGGPA